MDPMFFLAKLARFLLGPHTMLMAGVFLSLLLVTRRGRRAQALGKGLLALVALFLVVCATPLPHLLLNRLENAALPPAMPAPGQVAGIIVLGGGQDQVMAELRPDPAALNEAGDRLMKTLLLARAYPDSPIMLSGGSANPMHDDRAEAASSARLLAGVGIEPARLVEEGGSANTWENARRTRAVLEQRGELPLAEGAPPRVWLVVTSAWHMPRSLSFFEAAGIPVWPAPTDFRTLPDGSLSGTDWGNLALGLEATRILIAEYVGMVSYYLRGRTDSLWPHWQPPLSLDPSPSEPR